MNFAQEDFTTIQSLQVKKVQDVTIHGKRWKTSSKPKSNNPMWAKFGIAWCVTETGPMNAVLWNFSSNGGSPKLLRYCFGFLHEIAKNVIPGNSGLQCIKKTKQKCRDEETAQKIYTSPKQKFPKSQKYWFFLNRKLYQLMGVFRPFHLENVRSPQFSIAEEKNKENRKIATKTGQFPVIKNLLYQERKPPMLIHCMCETEEYEHIIVDNER